MPGSGNRVAREAGEEEAAGGAEGKLIPVDLCFQCVQLYTQVRLLNNIAICQAYLLLVAQAARLVGEELPAGLRDDLAAVLKSAPLLLDELFKISAAPRPPDNCGWLRTACSVLELSQSLVQARVRAPTFVFMLPLHFLLFFSPPSRTYPPPVCGDRRCRSRHARQAALAARLRRPPATAPRRSCSCRTCRSRWRARWVEGRSKGSLSCWCDCRREALIFVIMH